MSYYDPYSDPAQSLETDWDANRNENGSALYDMKHELEQSDREHRAEAWARNVAAAIFVVALMVLYWVFPQR